MDPPTVDLSKVVNAVAVLHESVTDMDYSVTEATKALTVQTKRIADALEDIVEMKKSKNQDEWY